MARAKAPALRFVLAGSLVLAGPTLGAERGSGEPRAAAPAATASPPPAATPPGATSKAAAPPPTLSKALALTVSGGVSLGAYEAGFLYYALAAAEANPILPRLKVATGASAGSVNALLSLRASCGGLAPDPRQSLLYRVWVPLGLRQLFQPDVATPLAAFSQESMAQVGALVEQELALGLPASCDVVLGVVTSRLSPRLLHAARKRLQVPVTEEKFTLRIQGRGPGKMPRITNYVDPDSVDDQALLPEQPDGTVRFDHLLDAVIASTSFPVAFPPRPVKHCVVRTQGAAPPFCPDARAGTSLFVDGGVFDNSPLRLAATLAAAGLERKPGRPFAWNPAPDLRGDTSPPQEVDFAFVSADASAFPDQPQSSRRQAHPSILSLGLEEIGGFVNSARSRELHVLIQEYPETAERLIYPRRHFPAASSPLYAFFGFFDRGFRSYDFDLGMYEARRHLRSFTLPRLRAALGPGFQLAWPEEAPAARQAPAGWASLACLGALFDGEGDAAVLCAGDGLASERILAQVSLDRLWDHCRPGSGWEPAPDGFPACAPAQRGEPVPRVPGVSGSPDWQHQPDEAEAVYMTRLLAAYGYRWTDIDVPRGRPDRALAALRGELAAVTDHLARSQPTFGDRVAVAGAGRVAVNLFYYVPPPRTAWVLFGRSLELGANLAFDELSWVRASAALQVENLIASLGSNPPPLSFAPLVGVDAVPRGIGSPVLQPSFIARAGYLLSPNDGFGSQPCQGSDRSTVGACSRPVVEGGAALAVTGIVRVQLLAEWYPPAWGLPGLWAIAPSLGFQLGF